MPWNEPGKNNDNKPDPWGGKRDQNPPDLDKLLSEFLQKVRGLLFKRKDPSVQWPSSKGKDIGFILGFIAVVLAAIWFLSGLFIVNPAEETVVLRLGKFADIEQPGLHWFARFIDTKYTVDVQKIYSFSLQGDFLTKSSDQNDLPTQIQLDAGKKETVTPDQSKNLVNVELNVQYRISDPRAYLFGAVNPDDTIQQVASGALSDVIGKMKLDEVLTTGREILSAGVRDKTRQILQGYNTGLEVMAVTLRKVQAPDEVRPAFNDVNRADQDRATYIQQAQAYASKVVPLAQGAAARYLADANAYQQQVVLIAQSHVAKYRAILQAYTESPDITHERLYLDAMQAMLKNTTKVLVDANTGGNMLYLPLDKLIQASRELSADNVKVTSGGVKNDVN